MTGLSLSDLEKTVSGWFEARGVTFVETSLLQPAGPFLDVVGEDLRRRIYLTDSEKGETLCLRPDFTVPVCLAHLRDGNGYAGRYSYCGQVFRQHRANGSEFLQAGLEDFGRTDRMVADADAMADAWRLVADLAPELQVKMVFGDQALFEAVVDALGLPEGWQQRMIRSFGEPDQIEPLLDQLSHGIRPVELAPDIRELAEAGDLEALVARLDEQIKEAGFSANASRSAREIATRLVENTRLANVRLDDKALSILRRFLALESPMDEAVDRMERFAEESDLDVAQALAAFGQRRDALADMKGRGDIVWRAAFGRALDYYTGVVFELHVVGDRSGGALIGGGRYDRLMTLLGADAPVPAVGFSLWLDRLHAAMGRTA